MGSPRILGVVTRNEENQIKTGFYRIVVFEIRDISQGRRKVKKFYLINLMTGLQRICYSHWANGAQNGVISIGQWGVFNHEKGAI